MVSERFPGGEWLDPAAVALSGALEWLDRVRVALGAVACAMVLLYVGAKIERHMLKSRLAVLDGAADGDVDLTERADGGRT